MMKKIFSLCTLTLFLSLLSSPLTFAKDGPSEEQKTKRLEKVKEVTLKQLDQRASNINQLKTCISTAIDMKAVKVCRNESKQRMQAFKKERGLKKKKMKANRLRNKVKKEKS